MSYMPLYEHNIYQSIELSLPWKSIREENNFVCFIRKILHVYMSKSSYYELLILVYPLPALYLVTVTLIANIYVTIATNIN